MKASIGSASSEASLLGSWIPVFSPRLYTVFPRRACALIPTSYKDDSHTGLEPKVMTSFLFTYLFKGLVSKYVTFRGHGG